MFTGLVANIGIIASLQTQGNDVRFSIQSSFSSTDMNVGDSIAVNGVCLTAESVKISGGYLLFTAFASKETLATSNLAYLQQGDKVNLELALALGQRLGGHLVSGHVDGLAKISKLEEVSLSRKIRFNCPKELDIYIVAKGSVCLDGISLTVNKCGPGFFDINLIPETWQNTTACFWRQGYEVNLEVDILGKYVAKMLKAYSHQRDNKSSSVLDMEFFLKNGFN